MADIIGSYWIEIISPGRIFDIDYTTDPFLPGTNIYANISLSAFNLGFSSAGDPDPTQKNAAIAQIVSYSIYNNELESGPIIPADLQANGLFVFNCARISFRLSGQYISAKAMINIFRF
jgi:hypothetical protein